MVEYRSARAIEDLVHDEAGGGRAQRWWIVRLKTSTTTDNGIRGDIIGLDDPSGSRTTEIPGDDFKKLGYTLGEKVAVQINKKPVSVAYVKTFMDVPVGDSLLYVDSRGRVGIADNEDKYSRKFNIAAPGTIFIPNKGASLKR